MELTQLWNQFRVEARSSYRLYSHDVDSSRTPGSGKGKHFLNWGSSFSGPSLKNSVLHAATEAENEAGEEYGEARLLNILYANAELTPALLLDTIMRDLDRFVGDAPQHDDVTLVLLKAS